MNIYAVRPGQGEWHLGKSSHGWKFLLKAAWEGEYHDWPSMQGWLSDGAVVIYTEYGDVMTLEAFVEKVENKQHLKSHLADFPSDGELIDGYEFLTGPFS